MIGGGGSESLLNINNGGEQGAGGGRPILPCYLSIAELGHEPGPQILEIGTITGGGRLIVIFRTVYISRVRKYVIALRHLQLYVGL